jgi:hypothetical protein
VWQQVHGHFLDEYTQEAQSCIKERVRFLSCWNCLSLHIIPFASVHHLLGSSLAQELEICLDWPPGGPLRPAALQGRDERRFQRQPAVCCVSVLTSCTAWADHDCVGLQKLPAAAAHAAAAPESARADSWYAFITCYSFAVSCVIPVIPPCAGHVDYYCHCIGLILEFIEAAGQDSEGLVDKTLIKTFPGWAGLHDTLVSPQSVRLLSLRRIALCLSLPTSPRFACLS